MDTKYLIGLDFGSDSVRALLVSQTGALLSSAVHVYRRWSQGLYCDPEKRIFRQHPLDYTEGIESVVKAVLEDIDSAKVTGIGVAATGSTPCAVDAQGTPLSLLPEFSENPNAMFQLSGDGSAVEEASRINEIARKWKDLDFTCYEGGTYFAEDFWSKALHVIRRDEAVRYAAYTFVEQCDWIAAELAGTPVKPSRCAAGHKALWHESWGGYPPETFFERIDPMLLPIRRHLRTETFTPGRPVGKLSAKWAERLGLPADVVVAGGALAPQMGAVGAGIQPNQLVKIIGTSTSDILTVPSLNRPIRGICGQVADSVIPGMVELEAGQSAFGEVFAWFKRFLSYGGEVDMRALEREAASLDSTPVMALDWFSGRRTPDANPGLSASLHGLRGETTPAMVYRALAEGIAFGSRAIVERLNDNGIQVKNAVAVGTMARNSPFIMQVLSDVMELPIQVLSTCQASALGAAMYAAVAAGLYSDIYGAMHAMRVEIEAIYTPKRSYKERYLKYLRFAAATEAEKISKG